MRSRSLAGAIALFFAGPASSPASAGELAFERLAELVSVDVSANLQALQDDFAQAPAEARKLGAAIAAALSDGTAVRAVTFVLILVIAGAGLEWLYWTFAAAPLRGIVSASAATPREGGCSGIAAAGAARFWPGVVHRVHNGCSAASSMACECRSDGDRGNSAGGRARERVYCRRRRHFASSPVAAARPD